MLVEESPEELGVRILPHFCVGMKNKHMDFGATLGGSAITGLVLAAGYALIKLLKRSRCASHTKCCDLDITRSETERKNAAPDLEAVVVSVLERLEQTKTKEKSEERLNTV